MSEQPQHDRRLDQAVISDEKLLADHERVLHRHDNGDARYRLLLIGIVVSLSALILFSGTYLDRYTGHYSPLIFDENAKSATGGLAAKIDPVAFGEKLYKTVCITCHQATGQGSPERYPTLAGSEWVNGPNGRAIRIVLYGLKGDIHVQGRKFSGLMPVFGQLPNSAYNWNDQKIAAVLTYIRQEWGNKASSISEHDVAAVRKVVGNHVEMSEGELEQVK
jgi:mono/diheme cytochrome c family protein